MIGAGTLQKQVLLSQVSSERWRAIVAQDLNGFVNVLLATLPWLKEWGRSSYAQIGWAGYLRLSDRHSLRQASLTVSLS